MLEVVDVSVAVLEVVAVSVVDVSVVDVSVVVGGACRLQHQQSSHVSEPGPTHLYSIPCLTPTVWHHLSFWP